MLIVLTPPMLLPRLLLFSQFTENILEALSHVNKSYLIGSQITHEIDIMIILHFIDKEIGSATRHVSPSHPTQPEVGSTGMVVEMLLLDVSHACEILLGAGWAWESKLTWVIQETPS